MDLLVQEKFLVFWKVRTGALIIGWLNLVIPFLSIALITIGMIVEINRLQTEVYELHGFIENLGSIDMNERASDHSSFGNAAFVILVLMVGLFPMCLLYLIGVWKKHTRLMIPMMSLYGLACVLIGIGLPLLVMTDIAVIILQLLFNTSQDVQLVPLLVGTFFTTIAAVITAYVFLIIYSYYRIVDREQKPEQGASSNGGVTDNGQTSVLLS